MGEDKSFRRKTKDRAITVGTLTDASGTGITQMFIVRLSSDSMADWIWIRVLSALKLG